MEKQVLGGVLGPKWGDMSGPSLTRSTPPPPGFSTLAQLKRREHTSKDGIIMIQTLLIILFIIAAHLPAAGQGDRGPARHRQGSVSPAPEPTH